MKALRLIGLILVVAAVAFPQTEDLGLGAYASSKGAIILLVDTSLARLKLDSPYLMFMAYMGTNKENQEINVTRDTVVMIYNGQEYKMPSIAELRKNYTGQRDDIDLYHRLGKEALIGSPIRFYRFGSDNDFYPALGLRTSIPLDEATLYSFVGFRTKLYFKNPGIKKGDTVTIKVWGKNNPALTGEVTFVLK